ncbi:MAG: ImmA/IrrE family metallo-endopeptidase [Neobacillus sp.]|jgi:Zn-dependent peptidase ImmA (M78 family)/transcriptional regulator with XRE-family HTH domain|nr:ImmA/IrrE family metallo-endopeptidase [Neobacillus sp.]
MQVTFNEVQYNKQLITLGRESRGISQIELSKVLGLSQGKMSKIEHGLIALTIDELQDIARALDYPASFFQRNERVHGVGLSEFYHRKRQTVPQKVLNKIYAKLEARRMEIASLLKSIDLGEPNFPHMDPDKFNGDVAQIAQIVRANWLIPQGPIENVIEIIEEAGGIVVPFDFEESNIDAITVFHPNTPPLIFTNFNRSMDRIRFTLCHELGHIIMHRKPPSEETDIEDQADRFASEFLMPKSEISSSLSNVTIQKLASLKLFWKVSMAALLMRAAALGKINEGQNKYLWELLSKSGYRKKEPEELAPPKETPRLLDEIIKLHQTELNYSISDLSQVLNLNDSEFRTIYSQPNSHLRLVK